MKSFLHSSEIFFRAKVPLSRASLLYQRMNPSHCLTTDTNRLVKAQGVFMRFSIVTAAVCIGLVGIASGAEADAAIRQQTNIPQQALESALQALATTREMRLIFASDDVQGRVGPPVSGNLTLDEALQLMLKGTNLKYRVTGTAISIYPVSGDVGSRGASDEAQSRATQVNPAGPASSVADLSEIDVVTVYGRGAHAESTREIPQSVTVFDRELLNAIPAVTLPDAVRFVPTSSNLVGDYSIGYNINIRASNAAPTRNNLIMGGVQPSKMELANVERVEVLIGPSSILYGSMQPGAVINVVTKQPRREFHSELGVQAGSFDTYGGSIDIGGPVTDRLRVRLNSSYLDQGAPFDHWNLRTTFVSPVATFDITDRTGLTLESSYRRASYPNGIYDGRRPTSGTLLRNPNGEIPLALNPGYIPGETHFVETYYDVDLRLKHEFSDSLALNTSVTYGTSYSDGIDSFAQALGADNRTIGRSVRPRDIDAENYIAAVNLSGRFETGSVSHRLVVGADYVNYESTGNTGLYTTAAGAIPRLDVFSPVYAVTGPLLLNITASSVLEQRTAAAFIQEQATFGDKFAIIAGARYTDTQGEQTSIARPSNRATRLPDTDAREWSTQFGLLYNVSDALTFYANRSTSFFPREAFMLRDGTFFSEPETAVQYELGTRFLLPGSDVSLSLAAFHIKKPNVVTIDPIDTAFRVADGEFVSKGIELSASGTVLPGWTAYAAAAYNPTEVTRSNAVGEQGLDLPNAPKHTFSLISRYEFQTGALQGLGLSVAANRLSEKYADSTNVVQLPGSTRVDLGLSYRLSEQFEIGLQANNITDEKIYNGFTQTLIARNAGRHYMANLKYRPAIGN